MAAAAAAFAVQGGEGNGARQAEVARKGAMVMPFDLARTTHYFDDRKTGGIETITANDKTDAKQIGLIREHLPAGARLTYASRDKAVVSAIHEWFVAQRSDRDAHMHMHHEM